MPIKFFNLTLSVPHEISHLMERVHGLQPSLPQLQVDQKQRDEWRSDQFHSIDRHLVFSPRTPQCAYSTLLKKPVPSVFQMPLHYPRYKRADYETMPEWKLDRLLEEYGLPVGGSLGEKRECAIRTFLWDRK